MVDKSLELLAELNKERKQYIYKFITEDDKRYKMLEKEKEFLEFTQELANIPAIKTVIIETLKDTEVKKEIREMACLVGLYIDDKEFWQDIAEIVLNKDTYLATREILSLLDSTRQKEIIGLYLKNIQSKDSDFVNNIFANLGNVIFNNNYFKYAEAFVQNNTLIDTKAVSHQAYQAQAMLAMTGNSKVFELMEEKFETLRRYKKDCFAIYLILAKSQKAFDYAKIADDKDLLGKVTRYGSPTDLENIKASIDRGKIGYAGEELFWYGNPKAIPWYIEALDDEHVETREVFHKLLLDFFDEESELREEGEELLDFDEYDGDIPPSIQEFQSFWKNRRDEIDETINFNQRYLGSQEFDMQELWAYEKYSDRRGFVSDRRMLLMIWTGQYFAFDQHALISKQLEQYKVIEEWLEKHKDEFKKGRWYRWGKDITDEVPRPLNTKNVSIASNSTNIAPKTGRYRASLPNDHPQAKQLQSDPHSYARFKKDDAFIYEGLEDYDLSEITWSYIGD